MDFYDVIRTRRSIRSYKSDAIPANVLRQVLDAARLAPSANNTQPWRFIVVTDPATRKKVAEVSFAQSFIAEAPVVIVCCGRRYHDSYSWIADNMYLVDVSIAVDHLTLAARNEGLGTCWIGAFDRQALKGLLGIPKDHEPVVLTPLGFPSGMRPFHGAASRKPLGEIVCSERFGQAFL
jgi:nitroreductase